MPNRSANTSTVTSQALRALAYLAVFIGPNSPSCVAAAQESYVDTIGAADDGRMLEMIAIPAGEFTMGSAAAEPHRKPDEGPQHAVSVDGFWMGKYEVTWRQFRPFLNEGLLDKFNDESAEVSVDAITRPTPISWHLKIMNLGMEDDQPVAGITQYAAKQYCRWLSEQTGRFYRLPTEAEWEYACRAGTTTAYSFGDDAQQLAAHAWFDENAYDTVDEGYKPVGQKKPNAWGLHDMHGNVAEWVLDGYEPDAYQTRTERAVNPFVPPTARYGRVVRGGSWMDSSDLARSAARRGSLSEWKDPIPTPSLWYLRSGEFVGFRLVRPFAEPNEAERLRAVPDRFQR